MNKILFAGAMLGLLSILMAAYIDHSLSFKLMDKALRSVVIAVRYHQLYAFVISIMGMIIPLQTDQRIKNWLSRSAHVFILGILLFSFSIYLSLMTNRFWLMYFTPMGGVLLIAGWCCLIRTALLRAR